MNDMTLYDLVWCITCLVGLILGMIITIIYQIKLDKERKEWLEKQNTETKAKIAEYRHINIIFRKRDTKK